MFDYYWQTDVRDVIYRYEEQMFAILFTYYKGDNYVREKLQTDEEKESQYKKKC